MKLITTFTLFLLLFGRLYAQDSSLVTKYFPYPNHTPSEVYWIDADSNKNGSFTEYYKSGKVACTGFYSTNNKTGIWRYYKDDYRNHLFLIYNWTEFKEIHSNYLGVDSIKGELDSNRVARFPGGTITLLEFIQDYLEEHDTADQLTVESKFYIQFEVNSDGTFNYKYLDKLRQNYVFKNAANKTLFDDMCNSMPLWIPSRGTGTFINTYRVPITFKK